jgi:hypothetical protein
MNGYMHIARDKNMCQVASENYYLSAYVTTTTTTTTTPASTASTASKASTASTASTASKASTTTFTQNGQIANNNLNKSLLFILILSSLLVIF